MFSLGFAEKFSYYDLAGINSFRGEINKAYENLKTFNQRKIMPYVMVQIFKWDPLFDNIRNESEFQEILKDVQAKYQTEHERVRKWLEENKKLY